MAEAFTDKPMNADPQELEKFASLAHRWWDPGSEFKPLHDINPIRLDYIDLNACIAGKRVLDVGCGGGILTESMAAKGALVTGIDLGEKPLKVARLHQLESKLEIDYRLVSAEALAQESPNSFDVVTCMEMLEHVPDPAGTVKACSQMVKPGGHVFFSTLNRNIKSYLFAVLGAEYILNLLPKGTHDYAKFIKPSELSKWCRQSGLEVRDMRGMSYNPVTQTYRLSSDVSVNYLVCCIK